ncbi:hypothetical protein [Dyella sp. A6]|uniref:hypothetical protein n=1 Tax=Dyella aluminiiresistens TaxID=3069105 RepID=UPI002E76DF1E|nr:hypothetical protein [Dyella sp. A6]
MRSGGAGATSGISGGMSWVFGIGMLLLGMLVAFGAWRDIAHRDGPLLVIVPAAAMSLLAASMARWTLRKSDRKRP